MESVSRLDGPGDLACDDGSRPVAAHAGEVTGVTQADVSRTEACWLVKVLKAVGARCIVLHHLAFRGSMADHARGWLPALIGWPDSQARTAYAVYLVHLPVCAVVNTAFVRYALHQLAWQALGLMSAWAGSLAAGAALHRSIEVPSGRLGHRVAGYAGQRFDGRVASGPTRPEAAGLR